MNNYWYLAKTNNKIQLETVLNSGVGINARDDAGYTFLHHASEVFTRILYLK